MAKGYSKNSLKFKVLDHTHIPAASDLLDHVPFLEPLETNEKARKISPDYLNIILTTEGYIY